MVQNCFNRAVVIFLSTGNVRNCTVFEKVSFVFLYFFFRSLKKRKLPSRLVVSFMAWNIFLTTNIASNIFKKLKRVFPSKCL